MPLTVFRQPPHGTALACTSTLVLVLVLLVGVGLAQNDRPTTPLSTAEIARRVTASVVTIRTTTGHGSGVIVDHSGVVITNVHVIRGETDIEVTLSNGDTYDHVDVIAFDQRRDLVALKIRAFNVTPAAFGDSDNLEPGERVVVVGTPLDPELDSTVTEGVISAIRDTGSGFRMLQTSAPISPGNSGGGMFDVYGQLIGIVTALLPDGQNLNFAVPVNYVRGLLASDTTMTLVELNERLEPSADPSASDPDAVSSADAPSPEQTYEALVKSVAADDSLRELVEFEEGDDGFWLLTYKGGDQLDEIFLGMRLIQDEFDANIVWIRGAIPDLESDLSASQSRELLELSYDLNLAKVTLDDDGSIHTMSEVELRTLDQLGLFRSVYAVADAADTVAELLFAPRSNDDRPTSPSAPASSNVAGRWTGSGTTSTAVWQGGGCHGESLRNSNISIRDIMIWNLNQSGPQITGSIAFSRQIGTGDPFNFNLGFSGTIVGNELRGTVGNVNSQDFTVEECGATEWSIAWEPMVFSGTVNGTSIDLSVSERGVVRSRNGSDDISSSWRVTLKNESR